jgi:hypothetical protein
MNRIDSLQELGRIRRRLAAVEKADALRHLTQQTDELRWVAPDSCLEMIAAFSDRIDDKLARCTPAPTKAAGALLRSTR